MSYEEFLQAVKQIFESYKYPKAYMNECLSSADAKKLLREHYEGYTENGVLECSPAATVLDLVFMREDSSLQLAGLIINDIPANDRNEDDENEEGGN